MPQTSLLPLEEVRRRGLEALLKELGPVGMARFLQQFETGQGDYTRDRHEWLGDPSVEELAARIREKGHE